MHSVENYSLEHIILHLEEMSFKLALYTANPYTTASTVYSATSEVSSAGSSNYTTTGNTLTGNAVAYSTAVASCDFD